MPNATTLPTIMFFVCLMLILTAVASLGLLGVRGLYKEFWR
jgi:hypothetical protein